MDQAFDMEDVARWQEWTDDVPNSMSVDVQVECLECGTAQPTSDNTRLPTLNKGGGVVERGGGGKSSQNRDAEVKGGKTNCLVSQRVKSQ